MTEDKAKARLDRFESNLFRDLYRSRWDAGYAAEVVPELRRCLACDDVEILRRTFAALGRIGPEAQDAEADVVRLLDHDDAIVREAAVWALGQICLRRPEGAVPRLIEVANDDSLVKPVLFALIGFGRAARAAIPLLHRTLDSTDARLRRLAIRGFQEIDADFDEIREALRKGLVDRSKEVRRSTEKLITSKWPDRRAEVAPPPSAPATMGKSAAEDKFNRTIAASSDKLVPLAAEALAEHRAGLTEDLNPDRL